MKVLFALSLLLALPAWAAPSAWQAQPGTGQIEFIAYWNGTPVKGRFPVFTLKARLDPAHPAGANLMLRLDTGKLTAQSADIARVIRGQAWFDVKAHPEAIFTSTSLTQQADGSLILQGTLDIKGHKKAISFPVTIKQTDRALTLAGQVRLDRGDFDIGSGQWAGDSVIAHKVEVHFNFVLVPTD